ncbi:MAG TPA: penicillin-binding protein 2 [Symbiobacteriaceae bacterium]|nr:penicillin-binding protein 2 [Symbiobacteriaceae bacterium]
MSKPMTPTHRRSIVFASLAMMTILGLVGQLGNLTLRQQGTYLEVAEGQRIRSLPVFAPRGLIYDRHMEPLVTNRPAHSVFVGYPYYKQPEVLQRISAILNMPLHEIEAMVAQKVARQRYYEPVRVKDDITQEQHAELLERKNELPGVEVQAQPVRVYPYKELAAHLLGYVNEVSQSDMQANSKYIGGELIGRRGLEAEYDDYLRGKVGVRQVEINNYFQPLGEIKSIDPEPGHHLVLTLDAGLQRVAERALDWDMWRIRNTIIGDGPWPHAKAGAVVVMDVKTGAILAMASHPAFDPNAFAQGISEKEFQRLQDPVLTPEVNRAIQTAYQPGSTWKMMTSAAALTEGVVGPYEKIFCNGQYDKAGNPKCWLPGGHGWVDTIGALQGSCDIYYYEMGYRMGPDKLVAMAKQFGFGSLTGIDLGDEVPGLLPDAQNRYEIWEKGRNDPWGVGHTVSASIGQIVQVTPLQLARYTATVANGGKVMKPYLVQKVVDGKGNVIKEFAPEQRGQVNVSPEHLRLIMQGMAAVNAPNGGTSDYAQYPLPGIRTGGKTGTAEYPPWDDFGFFVSVAPLEDPQIAIAVVIEQAGHGGSTSAVARAIEAAYFKVKLPSSDPAAVPDEFPNDPAGLRRKYRVVGTGQ